MLSITIELEAGCTVNGGNERQEKVSLRAERGGESARKYSEYYGVGELELVTGASGEAPATGPKVRYIPFTCA